MITEKVYKDRNYQRMYTHNAVHSMMPNINIRSVVYKIPTVIRSHYMVLKRNKIFIF